MTVAVSCNLSEGVILGVDSAVAVPGPRGIAKVYENAEKLFQLGERPIGLATFGLGVFASRSIGSYVREFESANPDKVITRPTSMSDVVEALRKFFMKVYRDTVIPAIEKETKTKFEEIPDEKRPGFGLVVGGFSPGAYLSEVWVTFIPRHESPGSAQCVRKQGEFGTNWFAVFEPIRRYIFGYDPALIEELLNYIQSRAGAKPFTDEEEREIKKILRKYEYQIPFHAMPMEEGIAHTRFLVELVVNHHRYVVGAPIVGGKVKIGKVTYKGEQFQILD